MFVSVLVLSMTAVALITDHHAWDLLALIFLVHWIAVLFHLLMASGTLPLKGVILFAVGQAGVSAVLQEYGHTAVVDALSQGAVTLLAGLKTTTVMATFETRVDRQGHSILVRRETGVSDADVD